MQGCVVTVTPGRENPGDATALSLQNEQANWNQPTTEIILIFLYSIFHHQHHQEVKRREVEGKDARSRMEVKKEEPKHEESIGVFVVRIVEIKLITNNLFSVWFVLFMCLVRKRLIILHCFFLFF